MADAHPRVGWGFDAHRFGGTGPVLLCGVEVDARHGVEATSDGDVAVHALIDAMLGAAALGDIGSHFGADDPAMRGADSMDLLAQVVRMVEDSGVRPGNVDITIVAESLRIAPHREAMRANVADALGVDIADVSVKATSTDGLGAVGADEGLAAAAVVMLIPR
jgi:2-C-methyl-D-erythritol 2,4-cyclodiphosphate synthase